MGVKASIVGEKLIKIGGQLMEIIKNCKNRKFCQADKDRVK